MACGFLMRWMLNIRMRGGIGGGSGFFLPRRYQWIRGRGEQGGII